MSARRLRGLEEMPPPVIKLAQEELEQKRPSPHAGLMSKFHASAVVTTDPDKWLKFLETSSGGNRLTQVLQTIFGVEGHALARLLMSQQMLAFGDEDHALAAIEVVANLKPANVEQSMLAVQMASAHFLANKMFRRAVDAGNFDAIERYVNLGAKLSRLYLQQAETLGRMQGRTVQQKIVVEHLNVESGGQAAIGVMTPRGGEGGGRA